MSNPIELPSGVRAALLAKHDRLRIMLAVIDRLASEVLAGRKIVTVLEIAVGNLRDELQIHQEAEERALESVLPTIDAWGPIRAAQMLREHAAEHAELAAGLAEARAEALAHAWPAAAARLRKHMDDEERTFLSGEVLRDDLVTVGPTS
jgi:Hemerythrin HHE cation binding domain